MWRRGAQFFDKAGRVVDTIQEFGKQWTQAAQLAGTIQTSAAEMAALQAQFGTDVRDPDWLPFERYLHDMRHEIQVEFSGLAVTVKTLGRIADQVVQVSQQVADTAALLREQAQAGG